MQARSGALLSCSCALVQDGNQKNSDDDKDDDDEEEEDDDDDNGGKRYQDGAS